MSADVLALEEINKRGAAWYDNLQPALKVSHKDGYVAIDVETGEYALGETSAKAMREMYRRRPDAYYYVRRIVDRPEPGLAARLFGMSTAREPERK